MSDRICPQCHGEGGEHVKEGSHDVFDACYACGTTGRVSKERYTQYRRMCLTENVAACVVQDLQAAADSDPYGEGWGFAAAENGLTLQEYTLAQHMRYTDRIARELALLDAVVLGDLMDRIVPDEADPDKTLLFRTYTKADFPGMSSLSVHAILGLLYPTEPECSHCGPGPQPTAKVRVKVGDEDEDEDDIPF